MANKNLKPIILISGLIVAALGGYYLYNTKFSKKKNDETAEETTPAQVETSPGTIVTTIQPKAKPVVIKNTVPVVPRPAPGFVTPPSGPQSVAQKTPNKGANLWVLSANGANAYKTAKAGQANVYKFYPKGGFVGTYLGKNGSFASVIVEETTFGIRSNKEVFVPAAQIYVK